LSAAIPRHSRSLVQTLAFLVVAFALHPGLAHAGAPLDDGVLGREGDYMVTCPWHDAHFDCRTGKADPDTPWGDDVAAYAVRLEGEEVWVDLPEE
jgi:nitrite reductase/ring-hydroxylating ferredoxin subunit